jgi:hypothetical protein
MAPVPKGTGAVSTFVSTAGVLCAAVLCWSSAVLGPLGAVLCADWHQRCWFTVDGESPKAFPRCGVRPGDPLADVIFCFAFSCLLQKLRCDCEAGGLHVVVKHLPGGLFASEGHIAAMAGEAVVLPPPTYMDDAPFLSEGDSPAELLARLAEAVVLLSRAARGLGFEVKFRGGQDRGLLCSPRSGL